MGKESIFWLFSKSSNTLPCLCFSAPNKKAIASNVSLTVLLAFSSVLHRVDQVSLSHEPISFSIVHQNSLLCYGAVPIEPENFDDSLGVIDPSFVSSGIMFSSLPTFARVSMYETHQHG
jgi:hypothetical protein